MNRARWASAAALLCAGFSARSQSGVSLESLQRALSSRFTLTQVTTDETGIVSAGTAVVLQKDGLLR